MKPPTGRSIPSAHVSRCVASLNFSRSLPLASFLFVFLLLCFNLISWITQRALIPFQERALSLPPRLPASDSSVPFTIFTTLLMLNPSKFTHPITSSEGRSKSSYPGLLHLRPTHCLTRSRPNVQSTLFYTCSTMYLRFPVASQSHHQVCSLPLESCTIASDFSLSRRLLITARLARHRLNSVHRSSFVVGEV